VAQIVDIFLPDDQRFVQIQLGIQSHHGGHEFGNGGDGDDGVGILLNQQFSGPLILHQGKAGVQDQFLGRPRCVVHSPRFFMSIGLRLVANPRLGRRTFFGGFCLLGDFGLLGLLDRFFCLRGRRRLCRLGLTHCPPGGGQPRHPQ